MNDIVESPYQYIQDRQLHFLAKSPYNNNGFLRNIKKSIRNPLIYRNLSKEESLADVDNTMESIQKGYLKHEHKEYSVLIERTHILKEKSSEFDYPMTDRNIECKFKLPVVHRIRPRKTSKPQVAVLPRSTVKNPQDCTEEIPKISKALFPKVVVIEPAKPVQRKVRLQQLMQQNVSEQMRELEKMLLKFDKPKRNLQVKKVSFQDEANYL